MTVDYPIPRLGGETMVRYDVWTWLTFALFVIIRFFSRNGAGGPLPAAADVGGCGIYQTPNYCQKPTTTKASLFLRRGFGKSTSC